MQAPSLLPAAGWNVSLDWTDEEQRTLEACIFRFPADRFDSVQRYVRIAAALPRKSVRDVALRLRWTVMQQQLKSRKPGDTAAFANVKRPGLPMLPPKPTVASVQMVSRP
jgi:hypothetical protein